MLTATVPASMLLNLNFDHLKASKLLLPAYDDLALVLAGCGGTGSWLAPHVMRLARLITETQHKEVNIYFIDPDTVELKNCYRQNFCPAEIGRNKAESLAFRYGLAWGVEIVAVPKPFAEPAKNLGHHEMTVLLGCVDTPAARRELRDWAYLQGRPSGRAWWLDCGNHQNAGQVLLTGGIQADDPFRLPGYCSGLPPFTTQHPELFLTTDGADSADVAPALSCAEMALQDAQGLAINACIAAEAADYLVRLLITKDLTKMATYIDLASGSARSIYITPNLQQENAK